MNPDKQQSDANVSAVRISHRTHGGGGGLGKGEGAGCFVRWEWSLCLTDHAPETRERQNTRLAGRATHTAPRCPEQRHKPHPHPGGARLCPAPNKGLRAPSAAPGPGTALTWPQTAPGPGRLSVPAAGTASLPSSACPGLGAGRRRGRLPPESPRRAAPAVGRWGGCGAAVQMETAARIRGRTGTNASAAPLL